MFSVCMYATITCSYKMSYVLFSFILKLCLTVVNHPSKRLLNSNKLYGINFVYVWQNDILSLTVFNSKIRTRISP